MRISLEDLFSPRETMLRADRAAAEAADVDSVGTLPAGWLVETAADRVARAKLETQRQERERRHKKLEE